MLLTQIPQILAFYLLLVLLFSSSALQKHQRIKAFKKKEKGLKNTKD